MDSKKNYVFELFCIEPGENDIKNEHSLLKALAYSARLWNGAEPTESAAKGKWALFDKEQNITLRILLADTSKMLTTYFETAFIIRVDSPHFDDLESFRVRLLRHLSSTLKFNHIRVLSDDISTHIANILYPEINSVENLLRRYLSKFFIQRVGLSWWETTSTRIMQEKANTRKGERRDEISSMVDMDVALVDFDDLGELIYKQSSGFNNPDKIISKLLSISTLDELAHLQTELQGNYTKYFKEFFQDKQFEPRWKELYRIRNKVAHHGTFYKHDLERGLQLTKSLSEIIEDAESAIDGLVFSLEEKQAIRNATIFAAQQDADNTKDEPENFYRGGLQGLKVVGKIRLPEAPPDDIITEEELLDELESAQSSKYNYYVGLKWFVTTYLANRGFAVSPTYSLINILMDTGKVEKYEVNSPEGYKVTAIRLAEPED